MSEPSLSASMFRPRSRRLPAAILARADLPFVALLLAAIALRVMAMVAYPPALFFGDSWNYIVTAFSGHFVPFAPVGLSNIRPSGYPLLVWLLTLPGRELVQLVAAQHLAGLITGTLVYALLAGAGVSRVIALLAAALVLIDGYTIALEQYVMAEPFFTLTLLLAAALVGWRGIVVDRAPLPVGVAVIAGLLLAAAALQRTAGLFAVVPFAVYLVWRRAGWRVLAALALALALPVLAYATAEDVRYGTFGLTQTSGWLFYGRVAGFADCRGAGIPAAQARLCETAAQRRSHPDAPTWYVFSPDSPAVRLFGGYSPDAVAQRHSNALLGQFARNVVGHQPLRYLGAVAADFGRYFVPGATPYADAASATSLPSSAAEEARQEDARRRFLPSVHPDVHAPATVLRDYRKVIHVPRPLVAVLLLASLAAVMMRVPRRREVLLFSGTALALILGAAATAGFGLRYLVPAVPLLAIGGGLAVWELATRRQWAGQRRVVGHGQAPLLSRRT